MPTYTLRRMKTYKPSFTPFDARMQKRLKMVWDATYWEGELNKTIGY
jgi:hypothetical protein